MKELFEGDLIYQTIETHLNQRANLDPLEIQDRLKDCGIGLSIELTKDRIYKFKRTIGFEKFSKLYPQNKEVVRHKAGE